MSAGGMGLRSALACVGLLGAMTFGAVSASASGQTAYVTNEARNTVTPIDVATNTPGAEITVGSGPFAVAITPDGKTAYVTNSASNSVTPIDVATNTPGAEIKGVERPFGIAVTPLPAPAVTKITKNSGPVTGDKVVTITGTNLNFARSVHFGGVAASAFFANGAGTEIAALVPAQEIADTVDVTVATVSGTSKITTKDHYKYLPVITEVLPREGSVAGGQEIEVFGAGFKTGLNVNTVLFGTTPAESFCEPTNCQVLTPAHAAGTVDVRITVNGLTSAKTKADRYAYK